MGKNKTEDTTQTGSSNLVETTNKIIEAGRTAIEELITVAKAPIIDDEDDLTADKLKNAAASKKLAIFDALDILERIESEEAKMKIIIDGEQGQSFKGFGRDRLDKK